MNKWLQILVVVWLFAAPSDGAAAEPERHVLDANWVMDVPVAGDHAVALIQTITDQLDQSDFVQGEWRQYQVGISKVKVTLTLLHRYDGAPTDFPTPPAGAEEWALEFTNAAHVATVEWTTFPTDRTRIQRVFTYDDRLRVLPRFADDPHVAMQAAVQHARLDATHPGASLYGVLKGGYPVWRPTSGESFPNDDRGQAALPRLLIVGSGFNQHRSKLGRDATMGPACIGWQVCGEQRKSVAAQN